MAKAKIKDMVVDCDLADETVEQLLELRRMRIQIVKQQLDEVDSTLAQLVSRKLIDQKDLAEHRAELGGELEAKLNELLERERLYPNTVHSSELEMYISML